MRTLHILISALILFSFFILTGLGHSAAPLGLLEIFIIPSFFNSDTFTSGTGDLLFLLFVLFALVGHILLLMSFKRKNAKTKRTFVITGQLLLLSTIIFLTKDFRFNSTAEFTLICSIPALLIMLALTSYLFVGKKYWWTN